MRLLPLLLFVIANPATAAVYKHVDENGVIRYSDQPPSKDAKPIELPPVQTIGGDPITPDAEDEAEPEVDERSPLDPPERVPYSRVELVSPTADQVFNNANPIVIASVALEPALQAGDRVVFLVDGLPVATPTGQTSTELTGLERGTHSLQAIVLNASNAIQAQSDPATFHLNQPSNLQESFNQSPSQVEAKIDHDNNPDTPDEVRVVPTAPPGFSRRSIEARTPAKP